MVHVLDLLDVLDSVQTEPTLDEVNAVIRDMKRNVTAIPTKRPPLTETLSEHDREFTAVGDEAAYNVRRRGRKRRLTKAA